MKGRERAIVIGATKGRQPVSDYNEVNLLETDDAKRAKVEFWIAKQIGEDLCRVYPRREWGVYVDAENEIVCITCPSVSTTKGYYLHIRGSTLHDLQVRARRAAGEILERHGITRDFRFNPDNLETVQRNLRDDVVTPDSAPEPLTRMVN